MCIVNHFPILVINHVQRHEKHPVSEETYFDDDFDVLPGEYWREFIKKYDTEAPHRKKRFAQVLRLVADQIEAPDGIDWQMLGFPEDPLSDEWDWYEEALQRESNKGRKGAFEHHPKKYIHQSTTSGVNQAGAVINNVF